MSTYKLIKGDIVEVRRFIIDVGTSRYILEYPECPDNNRDYILCEEVDGKTSRLYDMILVERITEDDEELKVVEEDYELKGSEDFLELSVV